MTNHPEKPSSSPSRKRNSSGGFRGRLASGKDGYALLIVMMMATILLISLTAALPNVYVEGQREKEAELIFRGEQYARAIMLFHKQFNRYPNSIKELLHTNNMSFLRHAYRDPMTKGGKWRFIHATANGIILDSKLLGLPGQQKNTSSGIAANANTSTLGGGTQGMAPGQNTQGSNGFSLSSGQQTGSSAGQSAQGNESTSIFGDKNKLIGAYIVGVASTSKKASIKVFENRTHYDDWEFLGVPGAPGGPAATPMTGAPSLQQGAPGSPSPQSSPGSGFHLGSIPGGGSNPR
ncbi:MAG TPA: hypothetical protein VMW54_13965 [Terriglobia bacterium]|nr:hypothetical protein [Terriglobia bacterium]